MVCKNQFNNEKKSCEKTHLRRTQAVHLGSILCLRFQTSALKYDDDNVSNNQVNSQSNFIPENHFLIRAGKECGLTPFGSHTMSDKALMLFPSVKMGVGDSSRSHTANEFVYVKELEEGITTYIDYLNAIKKLIGNEVVAKK